MDLLEQVMKALNMVRAVIIGLMVALMVATGARAQPDGNTLLKPTGGFGGPKRVALVIGNSAYRSVQALRNPEHDAVAVAEKLQALGYEVQYAQNVDRRQINEGISAFLGRIEPGTQTLVYYSGHGVELNGANYLLPTDIPALSVDQERMLRTEGINVSDLLLDVESRHAVMTLVILDACRDNPFRVAGTYGNVKSLGASKGLARVDPPSGSFVIFAAGAGEEALDNLGSTDTNPNGLFTRKLLTLMDENGLEIRSLVRKLRSEVRLAALATSDHHSQTPSYYDQMIGEFYFRPEAPGVANAQLVRPSSVELTHTQVPNKHPDHGSQPELKADQQIANLPPTNPVARPVTPRMCRQGQKWNGIECVQIACSRGYTRNNAGFCQRQNQPHVVQKAGTIHDALLPRNIAHVKSISEMRPQYSSLIHESLSARQTRCSNLADARGFTGSSHSEDRWIFRASCIGK